MIEIIMWDSNFFKRKIGELKISCESPNHILSDLKYAKEAGFKYIICKIKTQEINLIKYLESLGFYLTDIRVIWEINTDKYLFRESRNSGIKRTIKIATDKDIPTLREISKSLFLSSRFYNDPYFTKEEADNLHQSWIENSVKGKNADIVFCVDNVGYVTCKKLNKDSGGIILFGIKKEFRGKGIGKALLEESIKWFKKENIKIVNVRTQLRNIISMNFYLKMGFSVKEYDIVFAKIL